MAKGTKSAKGAKGAAKAVKAAKAAKAGKAAARGAQAGKASKQAPRHLPDLPSPPIPPSVSPITPPELAEAPLPTDPEPAFGPRAVFTHSTQLEQAELMELPPTIPIDFDSNTDVIALQAAISVLLMQKRRAEGDMQKLRAAKAGALQRPDEFVSDLVTGRIRQGAADLTDESGENYSLSLNSSSPPKPWLSLPGPQEVVRMPAVNWNQYAVVGPSLDRLHAEQVARPTAGAPATIGPDGSFQFPPGADAADKPGPVHHVAAPFEPDRDQIEPRRLRSKR